MVRPEVIHRRLMKIEEYLSILAGLQGYSRDDFLSNPEHYGATERFLQLVIEAVNDIGSHIIADQALGHVEWQSDIPAILAGNGTIDSGMKDRWIRMIGFRNALVHDYLDIDRGIVFDVLHHCLDDICQLKTIFATFL